MKRKILSFVCAFLLMGHSFLKPINSGFIDRIEVVYVASIIVLTAGLFFTWITGFLTFEGREEHYKKKQEFFNKIDAIIDNKIDAIIDKIDQVHETQNDEIDVDELNIAGDTYIGESDVHFFGFNEARWKLIEQKIKKINALYEAKRKSIEAERKSIAQERKELYEAERKSIEQKRQEFNALYEAKEKLIEQEKVNEQEVKKIMIDGIGEKIQKKELIDANIETLNLSGDARVKIDISESNTPSFEIIGCKNIIDLIKAEIINNCLIISQGDYSFREKVPLECIIHLKKLNEIKIFDKVHIYNIFQDHYEKDNKDRDWYENKNVVYNGLMNDPHKCRLPGGDLEEEIYELSACKRYNLTLPPLKIVMKDESCLGDDRDPIDLDRDMELFSFNKSNVIINFCSAFKSIVKACNNSAVTFYTSSLVTIEAKDNSNIILYGAPKVSGDQYDNSKISLRVYDSPAYTNWSYNINDHRPMSNRLKYY